MQNLNQQGLEIRKQLLNSMNKTPQEIAELMEKAENRSFLNALSQFIADKVDDTT